MAKNKGTYGKAKSDVELEDEFVAGAGKVATAVAPHTKALVALGGLVLLAAIGWATWDWLQTKQVRELTRNTSDALLVSVAPISAGGEGQLPKPESYPNSQARDGAALSKLKAVGAEGGPGLVVRLVEANTLLEAGKYDEAIAAYRSYAGARVPELTRAMAREGVGYAEEAKALALDDAKARATQLESALGAFQQMQPDAKGPLYSRALYHQGRILASLDRREQAIAKFREILKGEAGSLESEVEGRLAELESKDKGGK